MAVRIRMKKLGRLHRPYYRICAMDNGAPRGGRVLEELGTYDPMIPETDARVTMNVERVEYWLSKGALPTEKVNALVRKYGANGTHLEQQKAAQERLAAARVPRTSFRRVTSTDLGVSAQQSDVQPEQVTEEVSVEVTE